jgi:hypothetical protein
MCHSITSNLQNRFIRKNRYKKKKADVWQNQDSKKIKKALCIFTILTFVCRLIPATSGRLHAAAPQSRAATGSTPPGCAVSFRWTIFPTTSHCSAHRYQRLTGAGYCFGTGNVRTLHPGLPSASKWKDFLFGGEPNEVSVSLPGSNALALAAGGRR